MEKIIVIKTIKLILFNWKILKLNKMLIKVKLYLNFMEFIQKIIIFFDNKKIGVIENETYSARKLN
jgi:hypothetical protein